ncbi:cobalamin biosynthesis protein CobW [Pseudoalteromonas sp. C2R02]|uniref:GTP-binding protein n=1 Tax=Pseudoalteromonas sp. C2R02 TaxID=2841565 RepID=UPI001C083CE4|nr:GTP-binding protein [Pseudoalteromonas sp. C2R02]MBU2972145.1 cobalamin biosynthesis protein CobW [Pseudoalteromonas sp. C2R02]
MEAIVVIVGFLGAGKTTLLKKLVESAFERDWSPFVILNDYESASLDAAQLSHKINPNFLKALNGSCICCSGITELRESVNRIQTRDNGITFIEANGTTDACSLMGFLGVGINQRFLSPIQLSVVDVKNWQQRGEHNELEANQIQVSSIIVLTHEDKVAEQRITDVKQHLKTLNPNATILTSDMLNIEMLPEASPSHNQADKLEHHKAHWASSSTDLPPLPDYICVKDICEALPSSILRIKGCTKIANEPHYTYFERCPDGEVYVRPYKGEPTTGAKLLTIGPGSDKALLERVINQALKQSSKR